MFAKIQRRPARTRAGHSLTRSLVILTVTGCLLVTVVAIKPGPAQVVSHEPVRVSAKNVVFSPQTATVTGLAQRIDRPDVLDLEPAVAQAELILVVRLQDLTETKIVRGGRNVEITEQFRFEPVRVLKGIFARESLLMTGQDLGIYRFAESSDRLARGQLMLILLGRQGENFFNCCAGPTLGQSIPRLASKDDALIPAVEVLIGMIRQRDRAARVTLLRDGLKTAKGRGAATLLLSLSRRSLLAARAPGVLDAIIPHLKTGIPAIREVAARTLGEIMDADHSMRQSPVRAEIVKALVTSLDTAGPDVAARVASIDAIGSAGEAAGRDGKALTWLKADRAAPTLAETAARLRALGKLGAVDQKAEVARMYEAMPLDALAELQEAAGQALAQMDPKAAAALISSRLANKHASGLGLALEIELLGRLPAPIGAPELLKAWGRPLAPIESVAFAAACANVADPRLVPAVATLLDPRQWQIRAFAVETLTKIDTDEAASALWPHVDEEADLSRRLRLIAFVGRHGYRDGYVQAIEHLSLVVLREEAVEAIGAIGEPKAIPELRRIWQSSNDLAWNAAAIRALARLGEGDIAPNLLEIARKPGNALAPSALIGLGDLGSAEALPLVVQSLSSRSNEIVIAGTRAAAKLLARPHLKSDVTRDRLAAILTDADAAAPVRQAAFDALVTLNDRRLPHALATVARDANLEGTPLLAEVEYELSRRVSPTRKIEVQVP
jgi:HEAT repeat protein